MDFVGVFNKTIIPLLLVGNELPSTPGTSPAVRARGLGVGQIKNNFSSFCEVRVTSRAVWMKTAYVQGKTQEFVGECLERNNISYQN